MGWGFLAPNKLGFYNSSVKKVLSQALIWLMVLAFSQLSSQSANAFTLYRFTSHTFYTCGTVGNIGPTLASCKSYYSTTWDEDPDNFTVVGGIQYWTVPFTGRYYIDAYGAGSAMTAGTVGGYGARIADTFDLTQGEVIRILVGQAPRYWSYTANNGGGGTFITRTPHDTDTAILIIAGGGGGSDSPTVTQSLANASISKSGNRGSGSGVVGDTGPGAGGINGNGGGTAANAYAGGGGGGFYSDGATNTLWKNNGGKSYLNGGAGALPGSGWSNNYEGGFGGGGGSMGSGAGGGGGGGGGYSGGGGGDNTYGEAGGGGGSYFDNGLNINRITSSTGKAPNNNGSVTITALTFPSLTVSVAGGARSVTKGQSVTLTATVNQIAQVNFYADGKKIANCSNKSTSSGTVSCNWKPSTQKAVNLTASIVVGGSNYVTSPVLPVTVARRTGLRS